MTLRGKDHFSQTGGVRLDMSNVSFPFARLSVYPRELCLSCFGETYRFPKSRIIALSKHRGLFSIGLRIDHNVPVYPKFVVFWIATFFKKSHFASLRERLQAVGYEVREY